MKNDLYPVIFIPHGGGPCFFMDWTRGPANTWDKMASWLENFPRSLPQKPRAIVIFSAHWETDIIRINSHPNPALIYDYYGFPEHTYQLGYPAPGSPALAERIKNLLSAANIASELDPEHGFDHGTFIPLKVMFPDADIPVVQVSLQAGLDPKLHLQMGAALASLREDNILLLGSGMSFHNMQILMQGHDPQNHSEHFNQWLNQSCTATPSERNQRLSRWQAAPSALACHPREEHLLPLMVIAGSAHDEVGKNVFTDKVMGATVSAYQFG
tara:strand:+ start:3379 stop:4188 length:810 start_codon:yes stop_codon:yes gene_type:complete